MALEKELLDTLKDIARHLAVGNALHAAAHGALGDAERAHLKLDELLGRSKPAEAPAEVTSDDPAAEAPAEPAPAPKAKPAAKKSEPKAAA